MDLWRNWQQRTMVVASMILVLLSISCEADSVRASFVVSVTVVRPVATTTPTGTITGDTAPESMTKRTRILNGEVYTIVEVTY